MDITFWTKRWEEGKTGWHQHQVNSKLKRFWSELGIPQSAIVFVPFCGMSIDMVWLAQRHDMILGVEASRIAVEQFMKQHADEYRIQDSGEFTVYSSSRYELWCGDMFKLSPHQSPTPDALYDRGGIVSLPEDLRQKYAATILNLTDGRAPMLLVVFEYPQEEMNGPPFSVTSREIETLYGHQYEIELLQSQDQLENVTKFQQRGLSTYFNINTYHLTPKKPTS